MTQVHEESLAPRRCTHAHTHPRSIPGYLADGTSAHTQPHARARNRAKAHTRIHTHTHAHATAKYARLIGRWHKCTHATARTRTQPHEGTHTHAGNREASPAIWPMTQVHEEPLAPPLHRHTHAHATARRHTHARRQPRSIPGYLTDGTSAHTQPRARARARNRAKAHTRASTPARTRNREVRPPNRPMAQMHTRNRTHAHAHATARRHTHASTPARTRTQPREGTHTHTGNREASPAIWPMTQVHEEPLAPPLHGQHSFLIRSRILVWRRRPYLQANHTDGRVPPRAADRYPEYCAE